MGQPTQKRWKRLHVENLVRQTTQEVMGQMRWEETRLPAGHQPHVKEPEQQNTQTIAAASKSALPQTWFSVAPFGQTPPPDGEPLAVAGSAHLRPALMGFVLRPQMCPRNAMRVPDTACHVSPTAGVTDDTRVLHNPTPEFDMTVQHPTPTLCTATSTLDRQS